MRYPLSSKSKIVPTLLGLLFLLTPVACSGGSSSPTLEKRLDTIMADIMAVERPPGMILAVWTPTETYLKATGVADVSSGEPMTVDMNYRIGSQSKMYISTVILQMVDEGKVTLDDTISQHIDGVNGGDQITLLQVITNTSGLVSFTHDETWQSELFANPTRIWTPQELIAVSNSHEPLFAPGEGWDYSNTNFVVLGLIAEKHDGKSAREILKSRLFDPLGLTVATLPEGDDLTLPAPSPRGYWEEGEGQEPRLRDYTDHSSSWGWTSGGIVSNVADSKRWIEAAVGGGLISDTLQAERMSVWANPATGALGAAEGYGMGIGNRGGTIGHTGSLPGWTSGSYRMVAEETTIVFFFNFQSEISDPAARTLDLVTKAIRATR